MKMPAQKPGRSKQDYGTPRIFLDAVEARFGRITWDLAARADNHVSSLWLGPGGSEEDSLAPGCKWRILRGLLYLNPPFEYIEPWAWKCSVEAHYGATIAMLTPASVGSEWFRRHVHGRALALGLSPRMQFVGAPDPYIKDLMLSVFGPRITPGFDCWRWASIERRKRAATRKSKVAA